jgi:tetratricopeptide (TPR) repeat protein
LGDLAYRRFFEARGSALPVDEILGHLQAALESCHKALEQLRPDAAPEFATIHRQLGIIYCEGRRVEIGMRHFGESLRCSEAMQDRFESANTRYNAALALGGARRFADARDWARSALRDYESCQNSDQEVNNTLKLLEQFESALQSTSPPSSAHPPPPH